MPDQDFANRFGNTRIRTAIGVTGIHHVQITARPGEEAACKRFYGDILGLEEVPKPAPLLKNGGAYYRRGGSELHLSIEEATGNEASRRHVCFEVADLDRAEAALREAGVEIIPDAQPIDEWKRFYVHDPAGSRVEFAQISRS